MADPVRSQKLQLRLYRVSRLVLPEGQGGATGSDLGAALSLVFQQCQVLNSVKMLITSPRNGKSYLLRICAGSIN